MRKLRHTPHKVDSGARSAQILLVRKERKGGEKFHDKQNENVMEINQDKAKQTRQTRAQLLKAERSWSVKKTDSKCWKMLLLGFGLRCRETPAPTSDANCYLIAVDCAYE